MYKISEGITQSMLQTWLTCRKASKLSLEGWRPIMKKRSFQFGSLFHLLLETLYVTKKRMSPDEIFAIAEEKWRAEQSGLDDAQAIEDDLALAYELFVPYILFHKKKDKTRKWVELEGVFDLSWKGYRLRGRRDGLYKVNGKYWLFETKTAGRIDKGSMEDTLAFDFQNLFYITACEVEFGVPISGVCYNVIRKPSKRLKTALPDFLSRVRADIIKQPEYYFIRWQLKYTRAMVTEFQRELFLILSDFDEWVHAGFQTYRGAKSACCGRYVCEYIHACAANGKMTEYVQSGKRFGELEG